MNPEKNQLMSLDTEDLWNRIYTVNPLVIIGSTEADGTPNFAPKHMAFALGWDGYFGFVCTPDHSTYQNIRDNKSFSVSYPKPEQIVLSSLTSSPRQMDDTKPELRVMEQFTADNIPETFLAEGYLFLECLLDRFIDGFGRNSLILGKIIKASADEEYLRSASKDDNDLIYQHPLLCYLYPDRFAVIKKSNGFPFPKGFRK
ncbi:flavin reductase [Balneola sp. MJW-20]|uniref:flavin reductase n=1 Tax=Gracilimonas aurantiaca TaxID=3234185 RepID=UPI00346685B2